MAANSGSSNPSITLEKNKKIITITKKTVRFASNVYQTKNIAGFSEGEVDIRSIPWVYVIAVVIVGLILHSFNGEVGVLLTLAGISGGVWNFAKPKHYGLLLTLNSGDKTLFTTTDKPGLKKVISLLYDFVESEKDETFQISINNSEVKGNFIQGNVGGSAHFNSDD